MAKSSEAHASKVEERLNTEYSATAYSKHRALKIMQELRRRYSVEAARRDGSPNAIFFTPKNPFNRDEYDRFNNKYN